jgi:RNA polymerase sigma-70 factor, ECF subfamily
MQGLKQNSSAAFITRGEEIPKEKSTSSEILDYLMRRFGDQVMKLAYYYVRDRQIAEDIFQEAFCRVYLNLEKFRRDSSYFTWIYRITVNLCRDYISSAYFRRMLPWHNMDMSAASKSEASLFEAAEGGDVFMKVMELPGKYRVVIALYYFEELTTPEISKRLNIKETTVRTRLSRGRDMLKESLAGEGLADEKRRY